VNITIASEGSGFTLSLHVLWIIEVVSFSGTILTFWATLKDNLINATSLSAFFESVLMVMSSSLLQALSESLDEIWVPIEVALGLNIGESWGAISVSLLVETPVVVVILGKLDWVLSVCWVGSKTIA